MFSIALLLGFMQLAVQVCAVGAASSSTLKTASTTTSASLNCPTTFNLYITITRTSSIYLNVNSTGSFVETIYYGTPDPPPTSYTIRNNQLVTLSSPGGIASVPKGTTANGAYIMSTSNTAKFDALGASLVGSSCRLQFDKRLSAQYSLDTIYVKGQDPGFYAGPAYVAPGNKQPSGFAYSPAYAQAT